MKKCFLVICLLCSMSQMGFANVIIDLDVKLSKVVPSNYALLCGPTGCTYSWVPGQAQWMSILGPSGTYTPFVFVMKNSGDEGTIALQEGNSSNPIFGAGITLPDSECGFYSSTNAGHIQLRLCGPGGEEGLAAVFFTRQGNILTVRIFPNPGGFLLARLEVAVPPPPPQTSVPEEGPGERSASTATGFNAESISPNPFSQSIQVQTNAGETETINFQLLNSNGQRLLAQTQKGGQNEYSLETKNIPQGLYFLRVQIADRVQLYRVIKID